MLRRDPGEGSRLLRRWNTPSNIACTRRRLGTAEAPLVMPRRYAVK